MHYSRSPSTVSRRQGQQTANSRHKKSCPLTSDRSPSLTSHTKAHLTRVNCLSPRDDRLLGSASRWAAPAAPARWAPVGGSGAARDGARSPGGGAGEPPCWRRCRTVDTWSDPRVPCGAASVTSGGGSGGRRCRRRTRLVAEVGSAGGISGAGRHSHAGRRTTAPESAL